MMRMGGGGELVLPSERERERERESPGPSGVVRCLFVPAGERKERESYTSFVVREDDRSLLA
jgi:hypothetical protein